MAATAPSPDGGNRSLQRGLAVLDCIGRHAEHGARVADIVRACALERATVYRLLSTLISCEYVVQSGRFRYVMNGQHGARVASPVDDLVRRLAPVLRRVSEQTEDAAFAVVREGTQSHCIARHIGTFPVQVLTVEVGRRQPLGVGAAGLALLASLGESEADSIVTANGSALRAYGGMTPERLRLLLQATKQRGWAVVGNHVVDDALGVGIAVPALPGGLAAAISVAAPTQRMSQQRQRFVVRTMREALGTLVRAGPA